MSSRLPRRPLQISVTERADRTAPPPDGDFAISLEGVTKRFKNTVALDGIDFTVKTGEVAVLLGPNGAGKSTLLRILCTTITPDSGTALVGGLDVTQRPAEVRRRLGVALSDERSFYWRLTGRQNLEFFAAMYGLRRREARERAEELLVEVDLIDHADRRFDYYSSGMRARLSLARASLATPPIILLDEPTRTLDPIAAGDFRERTLSMARDKGQTVLFATHDLYEAAAVASRIVVVAHGRVARLEDAGMSPQELDRAIREAAAR